MYCPNCNNFVDDSRQNCPFCNAQIHNIVHVNTTERHVMEKIVGSRLYVVMAVAFTLYLVFMAMTVVLDVFSGAWNIFNILLTVFGSILVFRVWTLYMGTVKKAPENPRAEKMTGFFTCQKVLSIILAVVIGLGTLAILAVVPFSETIGNVFDKMMSEDCTVYDLILEFTDDEEAAKEAYDQLLLTGGLTEEDYNELIDMTKEEFKRRVQRFVNLRSRNRLCTTVQDRLIHHNDNNGDDDTCLYTVCGLYVKGGEIPHGFRCYLERLRSLASRRKIRGRAWIFSVRGFVYSRAFQYRFDPV